MKKLIFFLLSFIIMAVGVCTIDSCTHKSGHKALGVVDSTDVANQLEEFVNPSFADGHEAYLFADKLLQERYEDSVFLSLPEEKLMDICTVLKNSHKPINISSIVEEYDSGKKIYDNISKNSPDQNHAALESSISEQYSRLPEPKPDDDTNIEMSARSKDTVIDGKRVILIMKE